MKEERRTLFGSVFLRCLWGIQGRWLRGPRWLAGTKDKEHNEGGSDNTNDDVDQDWTGKAGSLLRWRGGRFHLCLDADEG
jgi:hypothetical protein